MSKPSLNLREKLIESPGFRVFFSTILPIAAGILSGTFVFEITEAGSLNWTLFYSAKSFYALVTLCFVIYWYQKTLYLFEKEIQKFSDADYCTAYMRSKCLPEAADRYRELIRNGDGGELQLAMDELKKVLK